MPVLLALCALAVLALAAGPFLYRALLPGPTAAAPVGCAFVVATGALVALLAGAAVWWLRRGGPRREPELDRRLWEAALGDDRPPDGRPSDDPPPDPAGRLAARDE